MWLYNGIVLIICRRRVGQEWKASAFVDPPCGRRRKLDGSGYGSKRKSNDETIDEESGPDAEYTTICSGTDAEYIATSNVPHDELPGAHDTAQGAPADVNVEAAVLADDAASAMRSDASNGVSFSELSFASDTAMLSSATTLPLCPSEQTPTVDVTALSPIDGVPSCDSGATAQLDVSSRSLAVPE